MHLKLSDLVALNALQGTQGELVRKHYADAFVNLTRKRYTKALKEFEAADAALPDYPQSKYKLALLSQALGDIPNARRYYQDYARLETNVAPRQVAQRLLEGLDAKKADYDKHLTDGKGLLARFYNVSAAKSDVQARMAAGRVGKMKKSTARMLESTYKSDGRPSDLENAIRELQAATAVFPLSGEANALLFMAYLEGNNPAAARSAADIVYGQDLPVSFYARVSTGKTASYCKLELSDRDLRIVRLISGNDKSNAGGRAKKGKRNSPQPSAAISGNKTKTAALGDSLANLSGPSSLILSKDSEDLIVIPISTVQKVETSSSMISLSTTTATYIVQPQVSLFQPPMFGAEARTFANTYTRLFSQYAGYDNVKLGKESMTGGEKFSIGLNMAAMAYGGYASAGGLSGSSTAVRTMAAMNAGTAAMQYLQTNRQQQRLLVEGTQFKLIPTEPVSLAFRVDEFK